MLSFLFQPPQKSFTWKKPKEKSNASSVPSATFRMRQNVHPLAKIHRTPTVVLNESRASMNIFLASSLESLATENKLVEETTEKELLGKLYDDKEYLQFLAATEGTVKLYGYTCKGNHSDLNFNVFVSHAPGVLLKEKYMVQVGANSAN